MLTKEQERKKKWYEKNKEKYRKKHKETYKEHPKERGYESILFPILLSLAQYDSLGNLEGTNERRFTLHQDSIACFASREAPKKVYQAYVGICIQQLVDEKVIRLCEKVNIISDETIENYWLHISNLYTANKTDIKKYCKEHKYETSFELYKSYKMSLNEYYSTHNDAEKQKWIDENKEYFPEYKDLLALINEHMPDDCQQKYLWDGNGRLYSDFAHTPNPDNEGHSEEEMKERPEMLEKCFGIKDAVEYDTGASIYRLTYNLNHRFAFFENADIYELIWKVMELGTDYHLNGEPNKDVSFHDSDERKYIKKCLMPIYMREGSITYSVKQFYYTILNKYSLNSYSEVKKKLKDDNHLTIIKLNKNGKERQYLITKAEKKKYIAWAYFMDKYCDWDYTKLIAFLKKVSSAMKIVMFDTTERDFYGREIFIFESNLHLLMLKEFLSKKELVSNINGREILQIINAYDGFYGVDGVFTEEMFQEAYHNAIHQLRNELNNKKLGKYYVPHYAKGLIKVKNRRTHDYPDIDSFGEGTRKIDKASERIKQELKAKQSEEQSEPTEVPPIIQSKPRGGLLKHIKKTE